jgi:hypothetical protein
MILATPRAESMTDHGWRNRQVADNVEINRMLLRTRNGVAVLTDRRKFDWTWLCEL